MQATLGLGRGRLEARQRTSILISDGDTETVHPCLEIRPAADRRLFRPSHVSARVGVVGRFVYLYCSAG